MAAYCCQLVFQPGRYTDLIDRMANTMTDDNDSTDQTADTGESGTITRKHSPLSEPPWPQFPMGVDAKLPAMTAESLYRTAMGITGLVRILHRSARLRDDLETFADETAHPLSAFDEGNLWSALTVLSERLNSMVEAMHQRAVAEAGPDRSPR